MTDGAKEPKAPRAMTTAEVMLAGGISGVAARLLTHPMDTVKTQMQVQGAVAAAGGNRALHYRGVTDAVAKIIANEGIRGFYSGFGAVITGIPFASGAYFGGYEGAKMLVPADAFGPTATYIVTGMLAQSLAGVVYTPLDVVKERLQAQHVLGAAHSAGNYKNFANAYATIVKTEGIRGLFKGYWASNFTWWPWNVAYFVTYEHGRDFVARDVMGLASKDALPPWASSGCAVAAAAAATVATTPIDLAKTRLQTMRVGGVGNIERGVFGIMRDVVRREGVGALWTGASARVLAIAPGSAVSFYVYESIKDWCTREDE